MRLSRLLCGPSLAISALTAALLCTSLHAESVIPGSITATAKTKQQAFEQTQALVTLQKRWLKQQGAERSRTLDQLLAKAKERQQLLARLAVENPADVLSAVIPEDKQRGMPPEMLDRLEQHLELSGELEVFYEDNDDGTHKLRQVLKTNFGERFELHIAGEKNQIANGTVVQVRGVLFGALATASSDTDGDFVLDADIPENLVLAADGDSTGGTNGGTALASSATFGPQSTLVININFQDNPIQPWTKSVAQSTIFGTASDFIRENSFDQTWLTGAVTDWLTVPLNSSSCDSAAIVSAARDKAQAQGFNLSDYNRFIYAFPYTTACPFSGVGSVGGTTSSMLINGSMKWYTVAHEMGHNLGLYHSHALECGNQSIGTNCTTDEYGDGVDLMGRVMGHYSAFQKERLGWLDSSTIDTLTDSGLYELETYASVPGIRPKVLKIPKGTDSSTGQPAFYYVELRQTAGFDSVFSGNTNVLNGVVLHSGVETQGNSSYLLDMTPGSYASSYADSKDPALESGYSFTDAAADISITTDWVDNGIAQVNVQMNGTQTSCIRANPSISVTPGESAWVAAGTTVTYSLTLTSRDSAACPTSSFNLGASKPSGWSAMFGSNSLSLAPSETRSTTLTVTSPTTASDGFYNIAISANEGNYSTSKTVTYVVDNPVSNSAPIADNDSASTAHNTAVTINVLSNDTDPDGDALTVTSISGVNGSAMINANGSITFTPASGFSGTETFSYSIADGNGGSASASVSVSVAAAPASNSAPVAVNDTVVLIDKSTPVTIAVLLNDWDPEGTALTIDGVTQGAKGDVQINANGTLTYTPGKPFKSDDNFSYTISDGEKTATASVQVQLLASASGTTTGGDKGNGKGKP